MVCTDVVLYSPVWCVQMYCTVPLWCVWFNLRHAPSSYSADACQVPIAKYMNSSEGLVPPPNTTFYMCPPCDVNCDFWYYQNSCLSSRFSLLFDNGGTVFLAAFMSIWAVLFLEFWKRKQYRLQHEWDVLEYELVDVSGLFTCEWLSTVCLFVLPTRL